MACLFFEVVIILLNSKISIELNSEGSEMFYAGTLGAMEDGIYPFREQKG